MRRTIKGLRAESALRQALQMNGTISLYDAMRENIERLWLEVIDGLSVIILLRMSYIDRCIWYIIPIKARTVTQQSKPLAIIVMIKDDEHAQEVDAVSAE